MTLNSESGDRHGIAASDGYFGNRTHLIGVFRWGMDRFGCIARGIEAAANAHWGFRDGDEIRAIAAGLKNPLPTIGGHDGAADDIGAPWRSDVRYSRSVSRGSLKP